MARAPYLALDLPPAFGPSDYGFDGNGTFGLAPLGRGYERSFFGGDAGRVIHSGQTLLVTKLEVRVSLTSGGRIPGGGRHAVRYELAAEECAVSTGEIVLDY